MQWATIEFARNVAGLADADSTECNPETPTRSSASCATCSASTRSAARCGSGATPASSRPGHSPQRVYGTEPDSRTASPSLRVQQPLRTRAHGARPAHLGPIARRQVRRDCRAARPSLVPGRAVPSGVQVEAAPSASSVCQLRRGQFPSQAGARLAARRRRSRSHSEIVQAACTPISQVVSGFSRTVGGPPAAFALCATASLAEAKRRREGGHYLQTLCSGYSYVAEPVEGQRRASVTVDGRHIISPGFASSGTRSRTASRLRPCLRCCWAVARWSAPRSPWIPASSQ